MIIELFGMYALLLILLFGFAELGRQKALGIIGSGLLIIFGLWIIADGLQTYVGDDITMNETQTQVYNLTGALDGNSTSFADVVGQDILTVANYTEVYGEGTTGTVISTSTQSIRRAYEDTTWSFTSIMSFTDFLGIVFILLGIYGFVQYLTITRE